MTPDAEDGLTRDREAEVIDERIEAVYGAYHVSARKARAWSGDNLGNQAMRRELVAKVFALAGEELRGADPVLDVGCGTGTWMRELSATVAPARLHGVDLVRDRLREAQRALPEAHFAHADGRTLPFDGGTFAVVLLFTVLLDLDRGSDTDALLAECLRVLAPGGKLLIYDHRLPNPFNRSTRSVGKRDIRLPAPSQTVTVLPPLARRLGATTPYVYPLLARVPALRTHRLWCYRKPS